MRPVDVGADTSWACLKGRQSHAWLDPTRAAPDATVARELVGKLFPSGLSFTQLEYAAQWAEATRRIHLIADEGLEPTLRRLCGDLFIDEAPALARRVCEDDRGGLRSRSQAARNRHRPSPRPRRCMWSAGGLRRRSWPGRSSWWRCTLPVTRGPRGLHPTDDCRNLPRS